MTKEEKQIGIVEGVINEEHHHVRVRSRHTVTR